MALVYGYISFAQCRPQEAQRFPIAEPAQTVKKGEQSRATRTSMGNAALVSGSNTDNRSHISRVYLLE